MGKKATKLFFKGQSDTFEENEHNMETFRQNPLENPLIMKIVAGHAFCFAKKEDLWNFRLVNKLWNEIFMEKWRSYHAVLRIHSRMCLKWKKDGIYLEEMFMSSGTGIKEMNPYFANKPFRLNHFVDWVTFPPPNETSIEGLYWTLNGSNLLFLEFSKLFLPMGEEIQSLKVIFRSCSNLRRLTLAAYTFRNVDDDEEESEGEDEAFVAKSVQKLIISNSSYQKPYRKYGIRCFNLFDDCPVLFNKFLRLVPNLKSLTIFPDLGSALNGMTFPISGTLLENEKYVELYSMEIMEVVDLLPLWRYVETVDPPLKLLDLGMSVSRSNLEVFRRIVNWVGDTLKTLELKLDLDIVLDPSISYFDTLTGIYLPRLDVLDIECYYFYYECPYYAFDFRALRSMPKLKTFHYESSDSKKMLWTNDSIDWTDLNGGPGWELSESLTPEVFGQALRLKHLHSIWFDRTFKNDLFIDLFTVWFPKLDFISTPSECIDMTR